VLRSKLQISDASTEWQLYGEADARRQPQYRLRSATGIAAETESASPPTLDAAVWEALEVAAGLPEIYTATVGEFVAQMLNLDCIGAIAWKKGCYTGQEIIARAHYRGQVKRRMRHFTAAADTPPLPGSAWTTSDGVTVRVVRSARTAATRCELLAVAPPEPRSVDELPLPYAVPPSALPAVCP
jgi:folate-binding protein YgfZ